MQELKDVLVGGDEAELRAELAEARRTIQALQASRDRLQLLLDSTDEGLYSVDREGRCTFINRAAAQMLGYAPGELVGQTLHALIHHSRADGTRYPHDECPTHRSLATGQGYRVEDEILWRNDGQPFAAEFSSFPIVEGGVVTGAAVALNDISARKRLEAELREQAEIIETVNALGQGIAAELDLQVLVQRVTDAATEICGAQFGSFFYNVVDADGESYTLYTISGLPREAFSSFPMPRNTKVFDPTFRGQGVVRVDDIRQDPRYGQNAPYQGMPPGHLPVVSYLAVPVVSRSGEVLGGLFFGHERPGVFTERVERIVVGLAAQAATAMDNARLFELARRDREAAEAAERRFRSLVDGLSAVVWEGDARTLQFTFVSQRAEELLGYPIERWLAEPGFWASILHPADRAQALERRRQMIAERQSEDLEYRVLHASGHVRWIHDIVYMGQEADGRRRNLRGVMVDVTERKVAEEELRALVQQQSAIAELGQHALASSSIDELLGHAVTLIAETLDVDHAAVLELQPDDESLLLRAATGWRASMIGEVVTTRSEPSHASYTLRTRAPVIVEDIRAESRFTPSPILLRHGIMSGVGLPILGDGEVYGVLAAHSTRPQSVAQEEVAFLQSVASLISTTIDRIHSEEALRAARASDQESQARMSFLAEASTLLASSLDYPTTLTRLARLSVSTLADWCAVDIVEEDGTIRRLAVVHQDPAKVQLAHQLQERYPPDPNAPTGVRHVVRTRQPELVAELPAQLLEQVARDEEHLRLLRQLAIGSYMVVPLLVRDKVLGAITLVASESGRRYDEDDLALAGELAQRAAIAVDNARLFYAAQQLNAELEQRVVERTIQLETALKELESFSYSVSHDLRAPLRTIDGFSLALLEDYAGVLDETGHDYLRRVRAGSQRMAQLIDDMLQLSRVTRSEMLRGPVDLTALAESVAAELQQASPKRQVDVQIAAGLTAEGDQRLLRIALQNLLGNAWKFTARCAEARIELGQAEVDGASVFYVRDNGAGFDMTYSDKLFGAFQRLHAESEFEGSGIGLATVQRIVRRHGGRIWATGEVGQGATFYFTL